MDFWRFLSSIPAQIQFNGVAQIFPSQLLKMSEDKFIFLCIILPFVSLLSCVLQS